jgi:hypothetical protein
MKNLVRVEGSLNRLAIRLPRQTVGSAPGIADALAPAHELIDLSRVKSLGAIRFLSFRWFLSPFFAPPRAGGAGHKKTPVIEPMLENKNEIEGRIL